MVVIGGWVHCTACGEANPEGARFCNACGERLEVPAPDAGSELPASIGGGRYVVDRMLGEGARKRVYAARDTRLGRDVAVAVIKTDGLDDAGRLRIDREARAMARLGDHPNIVTVFDVGDDAGVPYIVSELMPGGSVSDVLAAADAHRFPVERALRTTEEVARALEHAHARGVVHRDLKPANVWIAADGSARLGDFGLAVDTDRSRITSEGMVVGTVSYLAPEQAVGRAPEPRSDLYALGACGYEMLTGRPPFLGDDAVTVISQHLNAAPVAPSWHNSAVPPSVDALVLSLLAKDPDDRPRDATAVLEQLRRLQEHTLEPVPTVGGGGPDLAERPAGLFGRFVGRPGERAALEAAFDECVSGRSRLVMVVGEPGIGKTRLTEELGVYASLRGARVCWGHCYEGELGAPYLPFVEALRIYARSRSDSELRDELSTAAPEVATIVSEVRERFGDVANLPALDGDAERMRLFDGVASFLRNAAAAQPIVLLLDDLHWADKPTLLMLQYLARNLRRDRVLIVGTYRDVELERTHPLADAIATLRREHLYERVLLRGLPVDEVRAFIEAVGQQEAPPALAELVHRETEGNPFFVGEILRNFFESGAIARVDGQWTGTPDSIAENLPEGVREVIGRRLTRLSDDCNRMLTVGAAMPGGFSIDVAARVLDLDEDSLLDLLDEALDAQIVRERREPLGTYEFTHALIRQTLYGELNTPRRVRLHRQVLAAMEQQYAANLDARVAELAYHAFQAAPGGDATKAVEYATRAGDRAAGQAAHEEAARFYDMALQALEFEERPDDEQRGELLLALGEARNRGGEATAAAVTFAEARDLARRLDLPVLFARAALEPGAVHWFGTYQPEVIERLAEAVDRLGDRDDRLRALLLARHSVALAFYDSAASNALADAALEAAERSGDPAARARARNVYLLRFTEAHQRDDLRRVRAEAARLAEEAGEFVLLWSNMNSEFIGALTDNDRDLLRTTVSESDRIAGASRSPILATNAAALRGTMAAIDGRFDEAEQCAFEVLSGGRRLNQESLVNNAGVLVTPVWRERGLLDRVEEPTRRAVEANPTVSAWRAGLMHLQCQIGHLDAAAANLDLLAADDFATVPDDVVRRYTLAATAEAAVILHDLPRATRLYELLESAKSYGVVVGSIAYWGATDRYLGLLASLLGRHDDAVAHLRDAIAIHDRFGARPLAARTRYDLARALLARDAAGDREAALLLLNEALDTASEIGMPVLTEQALGEKLRLQGAHASPVTMSIDAVAAAVSMERPDLRRHASPTGFVTIAFSDLEDYTGLTERLGDARTQEVLRVHHAMVRDTLAEHGGVEVKSQGDGFMVAFSDPAAALRWADAARRTTADHDFGADAGPLRLRVGLHAGEAIREGDDFYGRTVIVAARVAAVAAGGEVLATDALRDAAGADGHAFGAPREVSLKGLSGTHRVYPVG